MSNFSIGLIKEGKTPPDERVVLTPDLCSQILQKHKNVTIKVQPSSVRRIPDNAYANVGCQITNDLADCSVLLGVKEVRIEDLLENKHYFFFSHTIKKQPYNRKLLQAVVNKNITLTDWETLVAPNGKRLIGFGRYAGVVGTYNGLRAYGLKTGRFELKKAIECTDRNEFNEELKKVSLEPLKIILTGRGRVAQGALEILEQIGIQRVTPNDFLTQSFNQAVYTQLTVADYNERIDGNPSSIQDFFDNPTEYKSSFMRYAKVADFFIAGHFWKSPSPYLFTREDAKSTDFNIQYVADISADINGPVATTIEPSTIANPIYGYNPQNETVEDYKNSNNITVMAVDNLPCELPIDASRDFGTEFVNSILPELLNNDRNNIINNATIAKNKALNGRFTYLQNYLDGKE